MDEAVLIVESNPVPGREDEYNDWYTNKHVPDILSVPGFVGARRYVVHGGGAEFRYLAIYRIQGPVPEALAALSAAGLEVSDSMEQRASVAPYVPFAPPVQ